jgi:hypothetical protein
MSNVLKPDATSQMGDCRCEMVPIESPPSSTKILINVRKCPGQVPEQKKKKKKKTDRK